MKLVSFFTLLCSLTASIALADESPGLDVGILKSKIAPNRAALEGGIGRARSFKGKLRGATHEITYEECKEVEGKIEAQYPLSPFRAVYKNGASFSTFCDWNPERPSKEEAERAGKRYFFQPTKAVNQLGIPAAYIMRILVPKPYGFARNDSGEGEYLLDSEFRFIEINGRTTFLARKGYDWDVSLLDSNGDRFFHSGSEASGDRGFPVEYAIYGSADGTLSATWRKAPRRADHGKEILNTQTFQVNEKNWEAQLAPINLMNLLQYFRYQGEWTSRPGIYDWLFEVNLANQGKEVCADGSSISGKNYIRYAPSDKNDSWSCSNIW